MPEERIAVTGVSVLEGSIGPNGNHLRWSFPPSAGFPPDGFLIYRRETIKPADVSLSFASLPLDVPLPEDLRIGGVEFITRPAGAHLRCGLVGQERRLTISPASLAQLELRFEATPLVHARLVMAGTGFGTLRAFRNRRLMAEVTTGGAVREVFAAGVNRLQMDLGSGQLGTISFTSEISACADPRDWIRVKKLPLPLPPEDPLLRLEGGLKNHYAASTNAAKSQYQKAAAEIVKWLKHLMSPTADVFVNPTAPPGFVNPTPPHLLKIRSDIEKPPTTATYLQSLFLLAALDPNVARLLSLYWVDAFEPTEPQLVGPPRKDTLYDYKVVGDWNDGDDRCGLLQNVGPPAAPLPSLTGQFTGKQVNGLRWLKGEWLGSLGLKWLRPVLGTNAQARAVQPVLYELSRIFQNKEEKIKEPILVDNLSWDQPEPLVYVDRDLKLGSYTYKVRPIDLFGQLGPHLTSAPLTVADNEAPPPPIRPRTIVTQEGSRAALQLQFEFGAAQHQQAPDVSAFELYWRADTLFTRTIVNAVVLSSTQTPAGFVHTVRLRRANLTNLPPEQFKSLVGDVLTNVISGSVPLPANQRRRLRIASVTAPNLVVLEPVPATMASQNYELVQDPRNSFGWTKLTQPPIAWREPLTGLLNAIGTSLPVQVLNVIHLPVRPDPFALVPAGSRPRQFPNVPPAQPVIEIAVNRVLTEPDVFADGRAEKTGWSDPVKLIYVVTNPAAGFTRIALPADTSIAVGDTLDLFPAEEMTGTVRRLTIAGTVDAARLNNPGGEIAFESGAGSSIVTSIMRVISGAANTSGAYEMMVRAEKVRPEDVSAIARLRINQTRIHYYAPFTTELSLAFSGGTGASIVLQTPTTTGYRDAYIAARAIDNRNNEGPLCTPSQFSLTLPGPSGTPSKPYPCGMDVLAPAGYASPPNRAGRATTCVTWDTDTLNPSEGLRFEVARAMDNTILTTHLRDWQLGKVEIPTSILVGAGPIITGALVSLDLTDPNGLIKALIIPSTPVVDPNIFRKGRLVKNGKYFQVTVMKPFVSALQVLLRGQLPLDSILGVVTIEGPPDYSPVAGDIPSLQALAIQVPDTFALVTGVPVRTNQFTDDIAGIGRNRFFYRVRAVDAAENRTDWSPISAPFYQVDTTPPEGPRISRTTGGERKAKICWFADSHDEIVEYRLYRATNPDTLPDANLNRLTPITLLTDETQDPVALRKASLTKAFGAVVLNTVPSVSATAIAGGPTIPRISAVHRLNESGAPDTTINFLVEEVTHLQGRRVLNVNPALLDGTEIVLVLMTSANAPVIIRKIANVPLTVIDREIDFSFPYAVSSVVGVFKALDVDYAAEPPDEQSSPNYFTNSSAYDVATHRLTGLASELEDGTPVAVLLRASLRGAPEAAVFVISNPVTGELLKLVNGQIVLEYSSSLTEIRGLYRADEFQDELMESQLVFDYNLTTQSRYVPETGTIVDLNPALPDGSEVSITYESATGSVELASAPPEWCYYEQDLPALPSNQSYWHRLVAVKRVKCGPAGSDFLEIPSVPTRPFAVRVFDSTPPNPPDWQTLVWAFEGETPVVQATWTSPDHQLTCTLQRRSANGTWLSVSPTLGPQASGEWQFVDRTADPTLTYEYRVRVMNRLGTINGRYEIRSLAALIT